jgi:tetratricopeptide (TPR) repeat protein
LAARDALANLQVAGKDFQGAIKTYQAGLQVEPGNVVLLNSLAYVQAYAGDLNGAVASIATYRRLAPNDANVYDTLAEIQFFAGRFADAEQNFVEANRMNKALVNGHEPYRAAVAAFLAGNLENANERFKEYVAAFQSVKDRLLPVRQAIWAYQTGDKSAVAQLQKFAAQKDIPPETASVAHAQLAIWLLNSDQRDLAREEAAMAMKLAVSPGSKNFAAVSGFLAAPKATAAEWKVRAERAVPGQPALQRQVLGYALLLAREYAEAAAVWKTVYDDAGLDAMGEPKVFLAYSYTKAGMKQEAATLMKTGILPPKSLDPGVPSLLVPYYIAIR